MALPWFIYAALVVFGATGIHFFSKLAKGMIDPMVALVYTMAAGLMFSACLLPFAGEPFMKSFSSGKGIALYALVGVCIALAHTGIFMMFQAGAPISLATPLVRFAPAIFAVLLGVFFFQETLKLHHILGIVLAMSGFFLMMKK